MRHFLDPFYVLALQEHGDRDGNMLEKIGPASELFLVDIIMLGVGYSED